MLIRLLTWPPPKRGMRFSKTQVSFKLDFRYTLLKEACKNPFCSYHSNNNNKKPWMVKHSWHQEIPICTAASPNPPPLCAFQELQLHASSKGYTKLSLYNYPIFQPPFSSLRSLQEISSKNRTWRDRHSNLLLLLLYTPPVKVWKLHSHVLANYYLSLRNRR